MSSLSLLFHHQPEHVAYSSVNYSFVLGGGYTACAVVFKTLIFACEKVGFQTLTDRLTRASSAVFPTLNTIIGIGCIILLALPPIVHVAKQIMKQNGIDLTKQMMTKKTIRQENAALVYLTRSSAASLAYVTIIAITRIASYACQKAGLSTLANRIAFPILTNHVWLPITMIAVLPAATVLYGMFRAWQGQKIWNSFEQTITQMTKEICEDHSEFPQKDVATYVKQLMQAIYEKAENTQYAIEKAPIWNAILYNLNERFPSMIFHRDAQEKEVTLSWRNPTTFRKTEPEDLVIEQITDLLKGNCELGRLAPSDTSYDDINALLTRLHDKHPSYLFFAVHQKKEDKDSVIFAWQNISKTSNLRDAQSFEKTSLTEMIVKIEQNRTMECNEDISCYSYHKSNLEQYYTMIGQKNCIKIESFSVNYKGILEFKFPWDSSK